MIRKCKSSCVHDTQDQLHGKGNRVLNHVPGKEKKPDEWRCTVCGAVHTSGESSTKGEG